MGCDPHRLKLLLLAGESIERQLAPLFDVLRVEDVRKAAAALAEGQFDVIWIPPAKLILLADATDEDAAATAPTHASMRQKMDAIHLAGRELVRMQGASVARMTVPERMNFLEQCVVKYARDLLHHDKFALRVLNERTGQLELVAAQGLSEQARKAPIFARDKANGITGYVAATGRSYLCADLSADPLFKPWAHPMPAAPWPCL